MASMDDGPVAASPSASPGSRRQPEQQRHLDAAARLQLAAALLEYDYEHDGKLAEHSAIFAPYRQEPDLTTPQLSGNGGVDSPHNVNVDDSGAASLPDDQQYETTKRRSRILSTTSNVDRIVNRYAQSIAPTLDGPAVTSRASLDFLSPKSENGFVLSPDSSSVKSPPSAHIQSPSVYNDPGVNEDELASEWGLDNVVSKFEKLDSNAFRMDASKLQAKKAAAAAATSTTSATTFDTMQNKPKGRKRSGTSGSDILLYLPDSTFTLSGYKLQNKDGNDGDQDHEEELDPTYGLDSRSAPTVLNFNQRKLRHRSGSELKAARKSFESELEMAFSAAASGNIGEASEHGGRSRSSSLGAFTNTFASPELAKDAAVRAAADYAAEAVARPASSLSMQAGGDGYISRFDPKAVAALRQEDLATRPRFPTALHPKILVMPAPLAQLEAEEKARQEEEEEKAALKQGESIVEEEKPKIEREAGRLYGRSLMDELQSRKERQRARNRAFRGDSRKAMMDMNKYKMIDRSPSPLSSAAAAAGQLPSIPKKGDRNGDDTQAEGEDDDDDDRPLRPISSAPIADDPWIKYTSHRSLANVAKGKSMIDISKVAREGMSRSPTSPALLSSEKHKSISPGLDTHRHTLSTAELQQRYKKKRQSMLEPDSYANETEGNGSEDDEDDDVPLGTRQEQLSASQRRDPASPESPLTPLQAKPISPIKPMREKQSVFGVDLVMQKELAKLEHILEIEEAERKIKAERERIKNAEKEAKEAKKRAKTAKKEKKRMLKEKAKAAATGKERPPLAQPTIPRQEDGFEEETDMQWRNGDCNSVAPGSRTPMQLHPDNDWRDDYQRQSYFSMQANGEVDDFYGADDNRNDAMPNELEEGTLTPRPGRNRSSSFAPSLTLPFLAGEATPGVSATEPTTTGWFAPDSNERDKGSDDDDESDHEERVRCKSPFGIDNFASDDEERVDVTAIWAEGSEKERREEEEARMRQVTYDPAKKPELQRMSVAASFAGVLEGFGIGGPDDNGSDSEGDKENPRSTGQARRLSLHGQDDDSDSDEDERRPLSAMLIGNGHRSQAFHSHSAKQPTRVAFEPPRLDLPVDFALAAKEDSDSDSEDETPLALKRLNASLTAGTQGRTFDAENTAEEVDSDEDDLPLAVKQDDDKPLGQAHPVAALSQQMEIQQQQNMALVSHLQLQYQYALQMQMQQAIIHQADIQGYSASQLNFVPPSAALSGAASDIGADLGPDPKLVNSVDRWRQGVE